MQHQIDSQDINFDLQSEKGVFSEKNIKMIRSVISFSNFLPKTIKSWYYCRRQPLLNKKNSGISMESSGSSKLRLWEILCKKPLQSSWSVWLSIFNGRNLNQNLPYIWSLDEVWWGIWNFWAIILALSQREFFGMSDSRFVIARNEKFICECIFVRGPQKYLRKIVIDWIKFKTKRLRCWFKILVTILMNTFKWYWICKKNIVKDYELCNCTINIWIYSSKKKNLMNARWKLRN